MNLLFILKTATTNIRRQKFITFAIILVILLIFILLNFLFAGLFVSYKYGKFLQQQQLAIQVFFVNDCDTNSALVKDFVSKITTEKLYKSYEYISSKEVHDQKWEEYFKNDQAILDSKPENPCDLLAEFKINPLDYNAAKILYENVKMLSDTNKYPIYNISYSFETQKQWEENIMKVQYGLIAAMIFLGIVVFIVINLLVDVSIRTRTDEIGIMQLVGANKYQVGTIFVFEGVIYGMIASILCLVFIGGMYYYCLNMQSIEIFKPIQNFMTEIGLTAFPLKLLFIIGAVEIGAGILLGIVNNLISVRKYL